MSAFPAPHTDDLHRNLMVNFIPITWDNATMEAFFKPYGLVESCRVIIDKATQQSKGFGFVKFQNRKDAESCLAHAQGTQVEGKRLKIQKAEFGKGPPGNATVYVSGFDATFTPESELQELFSQCGNVTKVKMHQPQPGKKGVAFITFEFFAEAQLAVDNLHGSPVGGSTLTVRLAEQTLRAAQAQRGGQHQHQQQQPQHAAVGPMAVAAPFPALNFAGLTAFPGAIQFPGAMQFPGAIQFPGAMAMQFPGVMQFPGTMQFPSALNMPTMQSATHRLGSPIAAAPRRFQPYPKPSSKPPRALTTGPVNPNVPMAPNGEDGLYCVFVYGVQGMDESFLRGLFSPYGTIYNCHAPPGKNFAFVNMPLYNEAANAINQLNGTHLPGVSIPIQVSFKK